MNKDLTSCHQIPSPEWGYTLYLAYPCQTEPDSLTHNRQPVRRVTPSTVEKVSINTQLLTAISH